MDEFLNEKSFKKRVVAGAVAVSLLLPACTTRKKDKEFFDPSSVPGISTYSEVGDVAAAKSNNYEDVFYHAEKIELSVPDLLTNTNKELIYTSCEEPLYTQDYILACVHQLYQIKPYTGTTYPDEFGEADEYSRWVIFNLQGEYLGEFTLDFYGENVVFDQDEQGNIVAFYSTYYERDGLGDWVVAAKKFNNAGKVVMEERPICLTFDDEIIGAYMCGNDEAVLVTPFQIASVNLSGMVHSVCTFPYYSICVGTWKENGKFYTFFLPLYGEYISEVSDIDEQVYEDVPQNSYLLSFSVSPTGLISLDENVKNADGMMNMHLSQGDTGLCAATKNAIGTLNLESGEFCNLMDWNQTDADRRLIVNGRFRILSEGESAQPLTILSDSQTSLAGISISIEEKSFDEQWAFFIGEDITEYDVYPSENMESESATDFTMPETTAQETEPAETMGEETLASELDQAVPEMTAVQSDTQICIATTENCSTGTIPVLLVLTPTEENPHQDQQIIWMGGVNLTESPVSSAVAKYNSDPSNSIWIKLHEYSDYYCNEDYTNTYSVLEYEWFGPYNISFTRSSAMERMVEQVSSGNGPDIIFGAGETYELDNRGCLTDLLPYMNSKNGINQEEYFESVFQAFQVGNKLYQVPLSFRMSGVMQQKDMVGSEVLTLEDCLRILNNDEKVLFAPYPLDFLVSLMACSEMTKWIDLETHEIKMRRQDIQAFLELCACLVRNEDSFPLWVENQVCLQKQSFNFWYGEEEMGALRPFEIGSLEEYSCSIATSPRCVWMGYPSAQDSSTSVRSTQTVGIAASSTQKEQAWSVIRYLLSSEAQQEFYVAKPALLSDDLPGFPVSRDAFYQFYHQSVEDNEVYYDGIYLTDLDGGYFKVPSQIVPDTEQKLEALLTAPHRRMIFDLDAQIIVIKTINRCVNEDTIPYEASEMIVKFQTMLADG